MFRLICGLGALSRMDSGCLGGEFEMNSRHSHESRSKVTPLVA